MEMAYKLREISDKFYYLLEKFIQKLNHGWDQEGLLKMGWKFLKILRKSSGICRKIQDNQDLTGWRFPSGRET